MLNDRLRQAEEKHEQAEAKRLVQAFKKTHEKGEFRNKLGRIWWPLWHKVVIPGASLFVISAGIMTGLTVGAVAALPAVATGTALWAVGRTITKGFSINVQNIAIKNAGVFGRDLCRQNVPEKVRKRAILDYLDESGAWFFNAQYVKDKAGDIDKMAHGEKGHTINNLVALTEYNLTREKNHAVRQRVAFPFQKRVEIYRQSYRTYQANKGTVLPIDRGSSR